MYLDRLGPFQYHRTLLLRGYQQTPSSPLDICTDDPCLAYSATSKMDTTSAFVNLVPIYQTVRCRMLGDRNIDSHLSANLRFTLDWWMVIMEHNVLEYSVQLRKIFSLLWIGAVRTDVREVLKLWYVTPRNAWYPHQTSRRVEMLEKLPPDLGALTSPKCRAHAEFAVQNFGYLYGA